MSGFVFISLSRPVKCSSCTDPAARWGTPCFNGCMATRVHSVLIPFCDECASKALADDNHPFAPTCSECRSN